MSGPIVRQTEKGRPIKMWTQGVPVEPGAEAQLSRLADMAFVHKWVAVMPDVHVGKGATVGSVVPTRKAIIPAAVGVDIGCGMVAARLSLRATDLPDTLALIRSEIEKAVPHGRTANGEPSVDRGAWGHRAPESVVRAWSEQLGSRFEEVTDRHPKIRRGPSHEHLGTLGTGNHFIELCLDEADQVWVMLHSGSRGLGNRVGTYFIEKAKEEMLRWYIDLPDQNLAYLAEGTPLFEDYVRALTFAQDFAAMNRTLMLEAVLGALRKHLPLFEVQGSAVNCHHNYVSKEHHFGENVWVTRKGAVRARLGDLGIIPGSMGARSYIVRGLGNDDSFHSSSHGAGRVMSRSEARRRFTVDDHCAATKGIECRKDADVIDETPAAYKPIDAVMAAQADLVEVVHTLRQVLCVKG